MKIRIVGGRIVDPGNNRDEIADILIVDGRIVGVGEAVEPDLLIDARGKIVIPGLIDMHTHLREPGREDEETIYTGSIAGVAGGFTTLVCMANTTPPVDNGGLVRFILEAKKEATVLPVGAITKSRMGKELAEIGDMVEAGAVAISDDGDPVLDSSIMRRALEYAKIFDIPVISHAEDKRLSGRGVVNEGVVALKLGLPGIPSIAEDIMVARDIYLAKYTGGRVHFAHVSTEGAVSLIREAKAEGVKVTAEVTPHHLIFTEEDVLANPYDTNYKVNPPLRTERDRVALIEALKDGTIDVIATDHAPHASFEKELQFIDAPFGIIGLETALPVLVDKLVNTGELDWMTFIAKLTVNPAKILGLDKGWLKEGEPAELVVFDPEAEWVFDSPRSLSRNSPFLGKRLKGKVLYTIVGEKVWDFTGE